LRSGQYEKTAVTAGVVWAGTTSATPVLINLTSTDANWQNYRYKVYQTTVPLRNVSWLGAQTGC
jgi:type IV pilus assembly protein PilW